MKNMNKNDNFSFLLFFSFIKIHKILRERKNSQALRYSVLFKRNRSREIKKNMAIILN